MMRVAPAITLSALLLCQLDARTITGTETDTFNNKTESGIIVRGGNLTVNSTGASTIDRMTMLNGGTSTFNINGGTLSLDLSVLNPNKVQNNVTFNVNTGTLTLTNGATAGQTGIFLGNNTTLSATLNQNTSLNGHLSNDGDTTLNFKSGSRMTGDIVQNGGNLTATLEGTVDGNVTFANTNASLWAYEKGNPTRGSSTITGSIIQTGGSLTGILKGVQLQGNFTQSGGNTDIAFHNGSFDKAITANSQATLKLHLYNSSIQDILAQNSTTEFNLKNGINGNGVGSTMRTFTGNNGNNKVTLIAKSQIQSLTSQTGGTLSLSVNDSSTQNIMANGGANLTVSLEQDSKVNGSITGNGNQSTTITSSSSTITGNISQNSGLLDATLNRTEVQGNFTQVGGTLGLFSATDSKITQGIILSGVSTNGGTQLVLDHSGIDRGGIKISRSIGRVNGEITNRSVINGGFDQTGRNSVHLTFTASTLNDGVNVRDGGNIQNGNITNSGAHATSLKFHNGSILNGGVNSTNHSIWLGFDGGSKAQGGDFSASGGDFYLGAWGGSTIVSNLTSQDTGETRLYLANSIFNGNVTQTKGTQHISMVGNSTLKGSIQSSNTNSTFANDEGSTLTGSYTQTDGTLTMLLGGASTIQGNVLLNDVNTTLGNGTAKPPATIQGSFTQNDGSLGGTIDRLTLEGKFTQNRGDANIVFNDATFTQQIEVNNANLSKILFDNNSNLITTTISGSANANNAFTLDHITTLNGDFILEHSKVTLGVKNGSKITGNIKSYDTDNDLKLDFDGTGNGIDGSIDIKNGKLEGHINGTTIGGGLKLEDATTHLHIKDSTINNGIDILRGTTIMTIDHSNINGNFSMESVDKNGTNPSLKLSINNGTIINGNLALNDTNATLGGLGNDNTITGSLLSNNSILVDGGDDCDPATTPTSISGLTINGGLQQTGGTLNLTFSNDSDIQGQTKLDDGVLSHLHLIHSKLADLTVNKGQDNFILLEDQSEQNGAINFTDTKVTLKATAQSSLNGNITSTATAPTKSDTTIILDNSSLTGNINQGSGNLLMDFSNHSTMQGALIANGLDDLKINLESSNIMGDMTITNSPTIITMENRSSISGNLSFTNNGSVEINASASTLSGTITHNGSPLTGGYEIKLNFSNGSTLDNISTTIIGDMQISSSDSAINSTNGVELTLGLLNLSLSNSTGTIENIKTAGANSINISTTNSSNSIIKLIELKDNASLTLIAQNKAILTGTLDLNNTTKSTLSSIGNANLKVDILPESTTTLDISLNGGIMQGTITQGQPLTGLMTLATNGKYGGRWIATDSSSIKDLTITNSSGNLTNRPAMQGNSFDTLISLVDTRFNADGTSRIGLSIIGNGAPDPTQTLARTITIGTLGGNNGVFRLYTDIGSGQSDKISANRASGSHIMQVYYNPATYTDNIVNKRIVIAHVDDNQTTVDFKGGEVDMGTQTYQTSLIKVVAENGIGFDWILGSTQNLGASHSTKVIASILQSQYRSYAIQTENLRQRMGELRDINRVHGLWGRYNMGSNYTAESDVAIEITDNYYNAWIGYDQNVLDLKGQNFYGIALNYALVAPEGEDYQGQIHNFGINLYDTFVARNDFYMDFVLKYILTYADYQIDYFSLAKNKPNYFNHKIMLSAEFGKKFKLNDSKSYFFLQPEGQITAGYIFGNTLSFIDISQTTIEANLSGDAPVILRTGLTAGYSLNKGSFKSDFYVGSSVFYETSMGGGVELDDGSSTVSYAYNGNFKMSIQGGFDLIFNDNARVYFEAGTSFMGATQTTYSINAGARFAFGYKNTRKLKVPSSITPPPPQKPAYDPRNIPVITDYTTEDIRNNNSATPRTPQGYDSDYFINTRKFYRDKSSITNNPKPQY